MFENQSGILLINKPINWTSNDVIKKLKSNFNIKKIGKSSKRVSDLLKLFNNHIATHRSCMSNISANVQILTWLIRSIKF